ncbi:UNKNOWN [Stylonychia lemnae]|uniref:Uncharacterized protein n=1 Tax=Stylonychia lemnae TaxID=5949 RepID=A0A077ZZL3_STYLE|nr:UNKNOWN [Stylonychia lemnae]|eukprot:CDW75047.1 UNKNOWN [Stylonychia lemnae]
MQILNEALAPRNSLAQTYFSQFYPDFIRDFTFSRRFVNHVSIIQQELFVKPVVAITFTQGLQKYLPFFSSQNIQDKVLIVGPSFIEEFKVQSNQRVGFVIPLIKQFSPQQKTEANSEESKYQLIYIGPKNIMSNETLQTIVNFGIESDYKLKYFISNINFYSSELIKSILQTESLLSEDQLVDFQFQNIIGVAEKSNILLAIQNRLPMIGVIIDATQRTHCQIIQNELHLGICISINSKDDLYYAFQYLENHKQSIVLKQDMNYIQMISSRKNQASLQYHIDQVIFDHLNDRQNDVDGFFKAHDYDLLLILSIGGTIGFIISYIIICDLIYVCFCNKNENYRRNRGSATKTKKD